MGKGKKGGPNNTRTRKLRAEVIEHAKLNPEASPKQVSVKFDIPLDTIYSWYRAEEITITNGEGYKPGRPIMGVFTGAKHKTW